MIICYIHLPSNSSNLNSTSHVVIIAFRTGQPRPHIIPSTVIPLPTANYFKKGVSTTPKQDQEFIFVITFTFVEALLLLVAVA